MRKFLFAVAMLLLLVGCSNAPTIPESVPAGCNVRVSGNELIYERAGFVQRFNALEGNKAFEDNLGVDWAVIEECNALALYTVKSGEVAAYLIFAPEGFPLDVVYKEPWMGAKSLVVFSQPGNRLTISAGNQKIN